MEMDNKDSLWAEFSPEERVKFQKIIEEGKSSAVYSNPKEVIEFLDRILYMFELKQNSPAIDDDKRLMLDLSVAMVKFLKNGAEKQLK